MALGPLSLLQKYFEQSKKVWEHWSNVLSVTDLNNKKKNRNPQHDNIGKGWRSANMQLFVCGSEIIGVDDHFEKINRESDGGISIQSLKS